MFLFNCGCIYVLEGGGKEVCYGQEGVLHKDSAQFGGVKVGVELTDFGGTSGLGTLTLGSFYTVQGRVSRGVLECWILNPISQSLLANRDFPRFSLTNSRVPVAEWRLPGRSVALEVSTW